MSVTAPSASALAAIRVAQTVIDRLAGIEAILKRQLELGQSSRKNFINSGTVAGGGIAGVLPTSNILLGNPHRRGLNVQNLGAAGNLSLGLGTTQPQPNTGITLLPGASWDGRISGQLHLGSLSVVATQAGVAYSWLDA